MAQVKDVLRWIDVHAPFRHAESWDNCGLQVGDPLARVNRILVALDAASWSLQEAEDQNCQCLVTHHPLIFRPLSAVRADAFPGELVIKALMKGIHIIAAHTNLDAAREGTNAQWVKLLALESVEPLDADASWSHDASYCGMGRLGGLPERITLEAFANRVETVLGGAKVRIVGDPRREVGRIALCTGSGGSLLEKVIAVGAEVYVTGDVKYHEAQRALEAGLCIIDAGHFASERLIVPPLAHYLEWQGREEGLPVEVLTASSERDPFWNLE